MKKAKNVPAPPTSTDAVAEAGVPAEEPIVIGIGASAGGMEAFQEFLEAMPPDTGPAIVFVQHLDPHHKSILPEILKRTTRMRILEAEDEMRIEPNCIYINPPNRELAISQGKLHLSEPSEPRALRHPIDVLLRSLARDRGDKAIGIILSGTGTDGTLGIRAVKGAGGTTIAQDTKSAKYDGMPRSAIATQLVDVVATAQEMPRILLEYLRHPYVKAKEAGVPTSRTQIEHIFVLLRQQTGHDFSQYKQNTIRRRIERRMAVHQIKHLEDYVRHVQRSPAEIDALFKDFLIGVTSFFRDPEAILALEHSVIPRLLEASAASGQIRAWIPGTSTGEEAYSIAMLLADHLDHQKQSRKVTIFASDIDPSAIDGARTAVYPDNIIADVPAERLERFFTKENGAFRISKRIREMVIFAVQDVLKDPPFSRLDLISCRNLLIYLGPELQKRLMQLFHAVLNPGGFLFLGTSESIGEASELFTQIEKKWKIYQKKSRTTHPLLGVTALHALNESSLPARATADPAPDARQAPDIGALTEKFLLDSYAPPAVVVDDHYDVVYACGRTGRYLELPAGEPHLNILKMARDDLVRELRIALHRALKERTEVLRDRIPLRDDGVHRYVRLRVTPFSGPRPSRSLLLVTFEAALAPTQPASARGKDGAASVDPRVAELEHELASMKESLQSTVEEVETSNEELRSTNEEFQSANEELQSTNEELETSKEELQSVNEELLTVNAELQKKIEELSQANNDLANLLNSTEIGTIFLDNDLRIKRFTPAMSKLINLIPSDVGRPIADIATQIIDDDLVRDAREVLRSLTSKESEAETKGGRCYLRRIMPYRTIDNVIDGVVITFVNITEAREAQRAVEAMLRYANTIVDAARHPMVLLNKEGRVVQANRAFYATFQGRREDVLGARFLDIDGGGWALPALEDGLTGVLSGGPPIDGLEVSRDVPGLGRRALRLHASRTAFGTKAIAGEDELTVLTIEDVTGAHGVITKQA